MNEDSFIVVLPFMVKELKLRGNELLIYAIIYGFSQDGESSFYGSLTYLAEQTGITKRSVINILKTLVNNNKITREEVYKNGTKFVKYRVCRNFTGGEKVSPSGEKVSQGGGEKVSPNNITILKEHNTLSQKSAKRFKKPTVEEVESYAKEIGFDVNAQYFIDYYESKGWVVGKSPMKDWKASLRTWKRNNEKKEKNNDISYGGFYNEH